MKIKLLHKDAKLPKRMTAGSSGLDVFTLTDLTISDTIGVVKIPLGISCEVPPGFEVQLRMRSSLASKGLILANGIGTIDSDYRGEVSALVYSLKGDIKLYKGERIAQLVMVKLPEMDVTEVAELNSTVRDVGGFGSTDIKKILEASKESEDDCSTTNPLSEVPQDYTSYKSDDSLSKPMGDI